MNCEDRNSLAERYILDDLPGASQTGARLNGILVKVDAGEPLSKLSQSFLAASKLEALQAMINGEIDWATYQQKAKLERTERIELAEKQAALNAAAHDAQAAQRAADLKDYFAAKANDPKLRRQKEAKELRSRFGIGYVDAEYYPRVMSLLRRVSTGDRLNADDVVWLKTEAEECWTEELQRAWNAIEAEALTRAWNTSGDPWDAINASSHWRKAAKPNSALDLTEAALTKTHHTPKIQSALLTTQGGALRDQRRLDDAKSVGLEAHRLMPDDFRPCTLLGAVHIELGDLVVGYSWYAKAEKLGATQRAVDQDLRSLLARASKSEQLRIREFLIVQDPERFAWLHQK